MSSSWTPPWVDEALAQIAADHRLRDRRDVELLPGGRVRRDGRELVHFASNDYLGLSSHPAVIDAAIDAAKRSGIGSRASAVVTRSREQVELEATLARFEATESALVFPSGFAANLGVVAALSGAGDTVFCDRESHACLVDGCRLSGASLKVYRRTDLDTLDDRLSRIGDGRRFIVTDAIFSMDGTAAPLPELQELAVRHDATLIVDEAHATGVHGRNRRGLCDHFGLESDHIVRTGTLSKAIGCQGGFVVGSKSLIDFLWNTARTQMFSTGLAAPVCAAATAAINLIESGDASWDGRLVKPLERFRSVPTRVASPIIPVVLGDRERTMQIATHLERDGFLVGAIREPTVARGTSRLRISVTRSHRPEDIERLAESLSALLADA